MPLNPNAPAFMPQNRSNSNTMNAYLKEINNVRSKSRKQRGSGGMGLMSCPKGKVYSWALKKCVSKKSTTRKQSGSGGMGLMSCPKGKVYSWALKKCVSKKSTTRRNRK